MVTSTRDYRVILTPANVPLAMATDIRTLDVSLEPSSDDLYDDVHSHLHTSSSIDSYALNNHWELRCVYSLDIPTKDQLRTALLSAPYTPQHWRGDHAGLEVRVLDGHHFWTPITLGLQEITADNYADWKTSVEAKCPPVAECSDRYLHDAMLQVVAEYNPNLSEVVFEDPVVAHDTFINSAVTHTEDVLNTLTFV